MSRIATKTIDIFSSADMSGTLTSQSVPVQYESNIGIQLVFTGSPTGTFTVQASNDNLNWETMTFSEGAISASGSGSSHALSVKGFGFKWIRVVYTFSSGTGVLNGNLTAKGGS